MTPLVVGTPTPGPRNPPLPPCTHSELGPGLLDGLCWGVQRPPLVGKLCPAALPLLQEERGPDNVEDGKHHTADVLAGLKGDSTGVTPLPPPHSQGPGGPAVLGATIAVLSVGMPCSS